MLLSCTLYSFNVYLATSTCIKFTLFYQGTLRINQRDYQAAYVDDPVSMYNYLASYMHHYYYPQDGGPDYFIPEPWARNRALNDDQVVIQIMPIDKWEVCTVLYVYQLFIN